MKCRNCGEELRDEAKFCENCGARADLNDAPDSSGYDSNSLDNDNMDNYDRDKRNRDRNAYGATGEKEFKQKNTAIIVLLCVLIGLMLLVGVAVGTFMFVDNQSSVIKESYDKQNAAAGATYAPVTPVPTAVPTSEPVGKPTSKPTATPKVTKEPDTNGNHIASPTYSVYNDAEMGFSCAYPTHFEKYIDNTNEGRYTLRTPDNTVTLRICAEDNSTSITLAQSLSMFTAKNPGQIEYSKTGNTYYAVRVNENGICRYRYLVSKNNNFYWFDFTYPEEYRDIYEGYIQHIYESFKVK